MLSIAIEPSDGKPIGGQEDVKPPSIEGDPHAVSV